MGAREDEAYELQMDALLGIRTTGRDESHASLDNNPYEPTPYRVLERVANSGLLGKGNVLVDYGCGKGRVGFFLSYQTRCRSVGLECDEWLHAAALRNQGKAVSARRTSFELADARGYVPQGSSDRFYFFNPFSVDVFAQALEGIRRSLDASAREAAILLYYPDDAFIELLAHVPWVVRDADVDCADLFEPHDPRERVAVYRCL